MAHNWYLNLAGNTLKVLYVNHTALVSGGEHSMLTLLAALPPEVSPVLAAPEAHNGVEVL